MRLLGGSGLRTLLTSVMVVMGFMLDEQEGDEPDDASGESDVSESNPIDAEDVLAGARASEVTEFVDDGHGYLGERTVKGLCIESQ